MSVLDRACAAAWPFLWDAADTNTPAHNDARTRMKAALTVVRDPDMPVVSAGVSAWPYEGAPNTRALRTFRAMIDAILSEPQP